MAANAKRGVVILREMALVRSAIIPEDIKMKMLGQLELDLIATVGVQAAIATVPNGVPAASKAKP